MKTDNNRRLKMENKKISTFPLGVGLLICTLTLSTLACNSKNSAASNKNIGPRRDNIDERFPYFESDILFAAPHPRAQPKNPIWPQATVVYQFCSQFTDPQKEIILEAMRQITEKTCITFKENLQATLRTGEDYVCFRQGEEVPGCNSYVGRKGGLQMLNLDATKGCIQHGVVTHLLGHALGLWHEHSRADRNDYVDINWKNVKESDKIKLAPYPYYASKVRMRNTPYDYHSIMHHSAYAFAEDPSGEVATIVPKVNYEIGQRQALSPGDVFKLKTIYNITLVDCQNAAKAAAASATVSIA